MNAFETTSTIGDQGQLLLAGVPFAPGTEVDVTITPKRPCDEKPADHGPMADGAGLRWAGNVLVHQGVGAAASLTELREEQLNRLAEARSE